MVSLAVPCKRDGTVVRHMPCGCEGKLVKGQRNVELLRPDSQWMHGCPEVSSFRPRLVSNYPASVSRHLLTNFNVCVISFALTV